MRLSAYGKLLSQLLMSRCFLSILPAKGITSDCHFEPPMLQSDICYSKSSVYVSVCACVHQNVM